ncbi:major facilitator superfamily domain-containing protein [Fusarium avenaceum]|nr:major facilitator superfamily domain-containing protein [Fusarium avenaceum]
MTAHYFQTTALGTVMRLATRNRVLANKSYKDQYPKEAIDAPPHCDSRSDCILVGWTSDNDNENPHNWSTLRKTGVAALICLYTFTVYCGSSIYVPSVGQVTEEFNVTETVASLGLALYVLGYGFGPLLFSPLSEIPYIGRNPIYIFTFAIFNVLCVGAALTESFTGFLIIRFLQGFFGSPCLATGAASLTDMFSVIYIPYSLAAWSGAMYCGPALGPLFSGFSVVVKGWRWSMWELLWLSTFVLVLLIIFLPETSTPALLYHRSKLLRDETRSDNYVDERSIALRGVSTKEAVKAALIKPFEISLKDPSIAFVNIYTSFTYGIYYSFFEVFPLVYPKIYGMNLGETSAVFVCVLIACVIGIVWYLSWYRMFIEKRFKILGSYDVPETFLRPGLLGVFGAPIGMFLFGWGARDSIPWEVPTLGIVIYCGFSFVVGSGIFIYLPLGYPHYAASLFAANDALRSSFAAAAILFGRPLYLNLGIGKGCSLLGGMSIIGIAGFWYLFYFGHQLRTRSRFTIQP